MGAAGDRGIGTSSGVTSRPIARPQTRYPPWGTVVDDRRLAELGPQPADRGLDAAVNGSAFSSQTSVEGLLRTDNPAWGEPAGGSSTRELLRAEGQEPAAHAGHSPAGPGRVRRRRERRTGGRAGWTRRIKRPERAIIGEVERLRQIVVCTQTEPVDAVLESCPRR